MKTAAFATALLIGAAAFAPSVASAMPYAGDGAATAAWETDGAAMQAEVQPGVTLATALPAASDAVVQPSNANPERDARGIAVISAAAIVPAGWNGVVGIGEAMGGPLLDPVTGEPMADTPATAPACTAMVTDHCLQTYERHRTR
jgi:hypothetical protein